MPDKSSLTQSLTDREADLDALQTHVESALLRARKAGATAAEVSARASNGLSVNVRLAEVDTLEHTQDRDISVNVFMGHRKGHATSADLGRDSILACVDKALEIARFTQEDPCNGLADAELMAREFPDLDIWHPVRMDARAAIARAIACEKAGTADPAITNSEGAAFEAGQSLSVYGNSHDFIGRSSGTRFSQSCVLIGGKGEGMQRDYSYDSRRDLTDLEPAEDTGREAARRTLRRLGASQLPTGQMPVIFSAEAAKGLLGHLVGAISGTALYRNASFLRDAAGEQLFPDWVSLSERPHLSKGSGSAVFDSEGVRTRERNIIEGGLLQGYALSSYSARRLGLATTGNAGGVRNLLLSPGGNHPENVLSQVTDGFYVTEVMGQGVSLITGDYSRGASGFRIKNGELTHAVDEVTIAGNLREMFSDIVAAGSNLDTRGNIHAGDILIGRMTIAGS